MDFEEAVKYLDSAAMFGIKLGLENVRELLNELGNPEKALTFIHLAGTNGKGSTAALLNAGLMSYKNRVGLFTSPHLIAVNERIRVNGEPVADDIFAEAMTKLATAADKLESSPTYFEIVTITALLVFQQQNCDMVVWETGMGGRLDSTNVVTPLLSVITNCALDHTAFLGDSIEKIATEKAGIIKPNIPVFYGGDNPKVRNVIIEKSQQEHAPLFFRGNDFYLDNYRYENGVMLTSTGFQGGQTITASTKLWGRHQATNVSLVVAILKYLSCHENFELEQAISALENAIWPGRLQNVEVNGQELLVDGAHNSHAATTLVQSLNERYLGKKWRVIVGILGDKDYRTFIEKMDEVADSFLVLPVSSPRAADPQDILQTIKDVTPEKNARIISMDDLLAIDSTEQTILTGSLYLIGELYQKTESPVNILTN